MSEALQPFGIEFFEEVKPAEVRGSFFTHVITKDTVPTGNKTDKVVDSEEDFR
ncbi:MAG: hypothetical protein K1Y36_12955 [Blastocatellia bacterium]|nr:hypothetical protein [Blastocatellia bacterium]